MSNKELNITESNRLLEQGRNIVAGFTQSMMKKPEQFSLGRFPVYLASGQGASVTDVDGNDYIDYICGLGATTLGHNHPVVNDTIQSHLSNGIIHSLPSPVEITAAQGLLDVIPGGEMVRFFKTGADANSAAIRLARYTTGREKIITVGYNGWHDHFMYDTPGIPESVQGLTQRMPLFTPADEQPIFDLIESQHSETAAIILSVPYTRELSKAFVQKLKSITSDYGIVFIFDEVVTGFRLAVGGAQEYFDVQADLVTLSKGIAAGMPLSAVVGKKALMSKMEDLQVSTTFGGEILSLAVCQEVVNLYRNSDYISHIANLGKKLKDGANAISKKLGTPLMVVGYDAIPMFLFNKNPAVHAKIAQEFLAHMAQRGIIMRRDVNFIGYAHTQDHIDTTLKAIEESLQVMIELDVFVDESKETSVEPV